MSTGKKTEKYLSKDELKRVLEQQNSMPAEDEKTYTIRFIGPWSRIRDAVNELYENYKDDASVSIKGYHKAKPGEDAYSETFGCVYFYFKY